MAGSRDPSAYVRKPTRYRRLVVAADTDGEGGYLRVRDVYLQSSEVPPAYMTDANTRVELCDLGMPCRRVVDLVRWFESLGVHVVYTPEHNMRGWFTRRRQDQDFLFDPGGPT
jgi:hypothetical protein